MIDVGLGSEKILRIQKRLSEHSFQAPIFTFSNAPSQPEKPHEHQLAQLCRQRPRAIVGSFHMLDGSVLDELSKYQKGGGIVVSYDCPVSLDCDQVIFDRVDNAYKAAMHLLMAGHRQIGIAASTRSQWLSTSLNGPIEARIAGFRRALCDFGVTMRPEWLFQTSAYEMGGAELAKQFLALKERPTGMCVVNDYVALAFMAELIKVGVRIPQELSIIGHDNQPIAIYCPVPLTSATQPVDKIVDSVVDLLIERLEGGTAPPRTVVITGDIVVRDSVAPPAL
jgi:DNA-binding LacI/PurR family transcriptional regulator